MLNAEDNGLLHLVEGDAPMGRRMRGHWLPACLSEEAAKADGTPLSRPRNWSCRSASPQRIKCRLH